MTSAVFPARRTYVVPLPDHRELRLGERPLVMGILNVTPDSFAEAAPTRDPAVAVERALRMQEEGADIIDVGGESTRPGTEPVGGREELARVLPVVRELVKRIRVPLSVDTYRAEVARAVMAEGVSIINDISGLRYEPELADVVAASEAALVLMHTRGRSKAMYAESVYRDLVADVTAELEASLLAAAARGVVAGRVIVDPGVGFAKRPDDSYGVLARLPALAAALDRPVLVGPSRKSFMREALGGRAAPERDWGTAAAVTAAVLAGAHLVRVHAVGEMAQVVRVAEEIRKAGERATGLR
jgi:dihydropteroate synthase